MTRPASGDAGRSGLRVADPRESAVDQLKPRKLEPGTGPLDDLAYRLWVLRRDALRASYLRLGVPVVEWRKDLPLQAALEEVRTFRRHARVVRA